MSTDSPAPPVPAPSNAQDDALIQRLISVLTCTPLSGAGVILAVPQIMQIVEQVRSDYPGDAKRGLALRAIELALKGKGMSDTEIDAILQLVSAAITVCIAISKNQYVIQTEQKVVTCWKSCWGVPTA